MLRYLWSYNAKLLLWVAPALMVVMFAISISCSSQPEVVVIERTVVVVKEVEVVKEVVREVVVTATPAPTFGLPSRTATPSVPTATPTPSAPNRSVLLYAPYRDTTQMAALGFAHGIEVKVLSDTTWIHPRRQGLIVYVTATQKYEVYDLLKAALKFVEAGGNAALFIDRCDKHTLEDLQEWLGVSCANMDDGQKLDGRGRHFTPFDGGYRMELFLDVELLPGSSGDASCVTVLGMPEPSKRKVCTVVYGEVGAGRFLLLSSGIWFSDSSILHKNHKDAAFDLLNWLVTATRDSGALDLPESPPDAATMLARFSTRDPVDGEWRAVAVSMLVAEYVSGNADTAHAMDLLHTIVPELSIDERRQAASELAQLSEDDHWDETETGRAIFYLAALITAKDTNPEERIEAAHELVVLYEAGELDAGRGLELMDTIAPGLAVGERRQAAAVLARLSADTAWDDADKLAAMSEVFRLVTGVALDAKARIADAVDLAGLGAKVFDADDSFDDQDIDNATAIIKQTLTGELTSQSLQNILESGN